MISTEALGTISYGMYIVASGDETKGNGYISNTVSQVTSSPVRLATFCSKNNHTAGLIIEKQAFSVSVLSQETKPAIFGRFGYKSGKDINKLEGITVRYGTTGVPVITDNAIAVFECRVVQIIDAGSHLIFIGELVNSEMIDEQQEPMTYRYYRKVRKGMSPENAPTYTGHIKPEPRQ